MTNEQLTNQIWAWMGRHKRAICFITGIIGTLGFLMEVFDVIH